MFSAALMDGSKHSGAALMDGSSKSSIVGYWKHGE